MSNARPDAVLVSADALMFQNRATLVSLAARHMLPAAYPIREFVAGGGLISYGTNYSVAYRQVGDYVGRVLNGEKPENLPVQRVTKLELVINITTAKALGLTVPPSLVARARRGDRIAAFTAVHESGRGAKRPATDAHWSGIQRQNSVELLESSPAAGAVTA
jgi:ABC-type uncharacterized transport system substrate-binding protein